MPDRVLLLGSVAAAVVPGALGWSHWSAEALLWTPAILAGIGARQRDESVEHYPRTAQPLGHDE